MSKEAFMPLGSEINDKVIVISELVVSWPRIKGTVHITAVSSDSHTGRVICLSTTGSGWILHLDLYVLFKMSSGKSIPLWSVGMKSYYEPRWSLVFCLPE